VSPLGSKLLMIRFEVLMIRFEALLVRREFARGRGSAVGRSHLLDSGYAFRSVSQ
jgi:hypothetical protein